MRKSGQLMRQSCYGPCVVFKDEGVATPWGAYDGWSTQDVTRSLWQSQLLRSLSGRHSCKRRDASVTTRKTTFTESVCAGTVLPAFA
jgi:hypothetical protein